MPFQLSTARLQTLIQVEESAECDVEAGFDWNHRTPDYLNRAQSYVNRDKLLEVLREALGNLLAREDIEAIATDLQSHTDYLISARLHP